MDAEALFQKLLRDLRPLFKEHGFRKISQNFVLETDECWSVVNFQKSRWNRADEKTFFVNVSVTAKRVLAFRGLANGKAPHFADCEWRWRAEQFGPDNETIKSWTIRDEATAVEAFRYLTNLFSGFVIPELRSLRTEAALIAKAGPKPGYQQGKACSILLAANRRTEELRQMVGYLLETYGGGVVAATVREHFGQLRRHFPEQMRKVEVE